jgi:hypothetical protein
MLFIYRVVLKKCKNVVIKITDTNKKDIKGHMSTYELDCISRFLRYLEKKYNVTTSKNFKFHKCDNNGIYYTNDTIKTFKTLEELNN